jgi:hypothetical protein
MNEFSAICANDIDIKYEHDENSTDVSIFKNNSKIVLWFFLYEIYNVKLTKYIPHRCSLPLVTESILLL